VVLGPTKGVAATGAEHGARILTASVNARHCVRAGIVGAAGVDALAALADRARAAIGVVSADRCDYRSAFYVRIASCARAAGTEWPVRDRRALGVFAARFGEVAGL